MGGWLEAMYGGVDCLVFVCVCLLVLIRLRFLGLFLVGLKGKGVAGFSNFNTQGSCSIQSCMHVHANMEVRSLCVPACVHACVCVTVYWVQQWNINYIP